jgi:transposase
MKKLEIEDQEIMQIAIQQEIIRSEESRYDNKLHGILLACNGMSSYEIANILGRGARTIEYWIKRFNENGFAGLREKEGRGRPTTLTEDELNSINNAIRKTPSDFGYTQNIWDGKILSRYISDSFNKTIGVRQCQRLFRKLGFRLRKPRPIIAKADPEAQEAYKKKTKGKKTK